MITLLHFVPEGSVILCEDPEAHLHPMAQSGLADLFVEVAKKRRLQVLIETHSEHLFRRLQVLIAGAKVSENDCALYYVERDEPSAKLLELRADEFGRIQNWPNHLFSAMLWARRGARCARWSSGCRMPRRRRERSRPEPRGGMQP